MLLKKITLSLFIFLCYIPLAFGQHARPWQPIRLSNEPVEMPRNSLSVELAGLNGFYSLNYERLLFHIHKYNFLFHAGGMYLPLPVGEFIPASQSLGFNALLCVLIGNNQQKFELGFGYATFLPLGKSTESAAQYVSPKAGFRRYSRSGKFYFSGSFYLLTPVSANMENALGPEALPFIPFLGFGFGFCL